MPFVSKKQIEQAREMDLLTYLRRYEPEELVHFSGNTYTTRTHAVLKHYEDYIAALATRRLYDEYGVPHLCVDEEKRKMLEIKLITRILDFEMIRAA